MKHISRLASIIMMADSYKASQFKQYPPGTKAISSYIEARGGAKESVFFGLQAYIKQYLLDPITQEEIDFAERVITAHGEPFNREGWQYILDVHNGFLPITIEAIPEGSVIETSNAQVQVVNTDPECAWLTSYLETGLLRAVWYPSTVATVSRQMKAVLVDALEKTSDVPVGEQIGFKLHDFGARGATSSEAAMLGGMGHLVNFMGTDTMEALVGAAEFYDEPMAGFSIPASEHSTITSWGRENEMDAYENMVEQFGGEGKIYACVSDSYNIWEAIDMWKDLEDEILENGGTLVIRPDSGDPLVVPVEVLEQCWEEFGGTTNSKGFRVLPDHIRVIQGDGITATSLPILVENIKNAGFSLENIAFGMGGGLLQKVDRDTLKYAMKASARLDANDEWQPVYKDPVHGGKLSKAGRLGVIRQCGIGTAAWRTVPEYIAEERGDNLMQIVYQNGDLVKEYTFEEVRSNAAL